MPRPQLTRLLVSTLIVFSMTNVNTMAQAHAARWLRWQDKNIDSTHFGFLSQMQCAMALDRAISSVSPPIDETEEEELSEFPNRDQAWNIKFAENIELYRCSSTSSIVFHAAQELTANERNDIHFNPRSVVWEEELAYRGLFSIDAFSTSFGLLHRCKHDIDNSDQEQNDEFNPLPQKRTIILSGLSLSENLATQHFGSESRWTLDAELRAELYLLHHDYRWPQTSFGYLWDNARSCISLSANLSYQINNATSAALRFYMAEMMFGASGRNPAAQGLVARSELQYIIHGKAAEMALCLVNERSFDEIVRISGDAINVWSVGLRFMPLSIW